MRACILVLSCFLLIRGSPWCEAATFLVTNTSDASAGSFRQALLDSNASAGDDTITFETQGTIALSAPLPEISGNLTIQGPGATLLALSGGSAVQILKIALGTRIVLERLTLQDGVAPSAAGGGAIENWGSLTIRECIFLRNVASGKGGGAIYSIGNLLVEQSQFRENHAVQGSIGGAINKSETTTYLICKECTFSDNRALGGIPPQSIGASGGAVSVELGSDIQFLSCIFEKNIARGFGAGTGRGGALFLTEAHMIKMENLRFEQNQAIGGDLGGNGLGGALFLESASLAEIQLVACHFLRNLAQGHSLSSPKVDASALGGALFADRGPTIQATGCTFEENKAEVAESASQAQGGAICLLFRSMNLTDCRIVSNLSKGGTAWGGGIAAFHDRLVGLLKRCVVRNNSAQDMNQVSHGGGIFGGAFILEECAVVGNQAKLGAGFRGYCAMVNCTIAQNDALTGRGGGLFLVPDFLRGESVLTNCTIALNKARLGGGVFVDQGSPHFSGVIISGNVITQSAPNVAGQIVSEGFNIINGSAGSGGWIATDILNIEPNLGPLADHGGGTESISLLPGSPAINATMAPGRPLIDQRGILRPQGSATDIGAFEVGEIGVSIDGQFTLGPTISKTNVSNVTVAMQSAFPGGNILFTLNGSPPNVNSTLYQGPFVLTNATTIRAIAFNADFSKSAELGPIEVRFIITYALTVSIVGMGSVSLAPPGGEYLPGTTVMASAIGAPGWVFGGWSGDIVTTTNSVVVLMDKPKSIQATFIEVPDFVLTTTIIGQGTILLDPSGGPYLSNTVVRLSAIPANGWTFGRWSGDGSGTTSPIEIVMDRAKSVGAAFVELPRYSVNTSVMGEGDIILTPPVGPYPSNSVVSVTAQADIGWSFIEWTGDASGNASPLVVVIDSDKTIGAVFRPQTLPLTLTTPGGGTVSADPLRTSYAQGERITLTATPIPGWQLLRWRCDATGTNISFQLTMDSSKLVEGIFGTRLTVTPIGQGEVEQDPLVSMYPFGEVVRLTPIPAQGHYFVLWAGAETGNTRPLDVLMDEANPMISALFNELESGAVTISVTTRGAGDVIVDPDNATFEQGTEITLLAVPKSSAAFVEWSGDVVSAANPLLLTIDHSLRLTARFTDNPELRIGPVSVSLDRVCVSILGASGDVYDLQRTASLPGWSPWVTITNTTGTVEIVDTEASPMARFYRAVRAP